MMMTKPMRYRDLAKLLSEAGFTSSPGTGDHEKWSYPGIERPVVITRPGEVSPGLVRKALKAIERKQEEEQA